MLKKKTNLIPIDTAVVVELGKKEEKTDAGIILTDAYREKNEMMMTEGEIIAIGDRAFNELDKMDKFYPRIGDNVCFKRYSGIIFDCEVTKNIYRVVQDIDIYAMNNYKEVEIEE